MSCSICRPSVRSSIPVRPPVRTSVGNEWLCSSMFQVDWTSCLQNKLWYLSWISPCVHCYDILSIQSHCAQLPFSRYIYEDVLLYISRPYCWNPARRPYCWNLGTYTYWSYLVDISSSLFGRSLQQLIVVWRLQDVNTTLDRGCIERARRCHRWYGLRRYERWRWRVPTVAERGCAPSPYNYSTSVQLSIPRTQCASERAIEDDHISNSIRPFQMLTSAVCSIFEKLIILSVFLIMNSKQIHVFCYEDRF